MPQLWLYYYKYLLFVQVINRTESAPGGVPGRSFPAPSGREPTPGGLEGRVKLFDKKGLYADNPPFGGKG